LACVFAYGEFRIEVAVTTVYPYLEMPQLERTSITIMCLYFDNKSLMQEGEASIKSVTSIYQGHAS
jgi:hypothetical protein